MEADKLTDADLLNRFTPLANELGKLADVLAKRKFKVTMHFEGSLVDAIQTVRAQTGLGLADSKHLFEKGFVLDAEHMDLVQRLTMHGIIIRAA